MCRAAKRAKTELEEASHLICIDRPVATEQCCLCLAAYEKHNCAVLRDGTFVKLLVAAIGAGTDATHIGPGRIALAMSMVSHLGQALSSAGAPCKQLQLLSRDRVQERTKASVWCYTLLNIIIPSSSAVHWYNIQTCACQVRSMKLVSFFVTSHSL